MRILVAAIVSESLLVILAALLSSLFGISIIWNATPTTALLGTLAAVPPFLLNEYLWRRCAVAPNSIYARFSREVIAPLCRGMTIPTAIAIAILSGLCEELFFRGALNILVGRYASPIVTCLVTSTLFAGVHFIGNFQRYGKMLPVYTLMGIYLWGVWRISDSLTCVAIAHGLYNFAAIVRVKLSRGNA